MVSLGCRYNSTRQIPATVCHSLQANGSKSLAGMTTQLSQFKHTASPFRCIFAMPSWTEGVLDRSERPLRHFDLAELQELPVGRVAAERAHLHLLAPTERLPEAVHLIEKWGFDYASVLFIGETEPDAAPCCYYAPAFLLLGVRGGMPFRDNSIPGYLTSAPSDISSQITVVEKVSPPPRLLLFSPDGYERDGWVVIHE